MPVQIDLGGVKLYDRSGNILSLSIDDLKNEDYLFLSYYVEELKGGVWLESPVELNNSMLSILKKKNGVRRIMGDGLTFFEKQEFDRVYLSDDFYCISWVANSGLQKIFTVINEENGTVVELGISSILLRAGFLNLDDLVQIISSINFKPTDYKEKIMINKSGSLDELDAFGGPFKQDKILAEPD